MFAARPEHLVDWGIGVNNVLLRRPNVSVIHPCFICPHSNVAVKVIVVDVVDFVKVDSWMLKADKHEHVDEQAHRKRVVSCPLLVLPA